MINGAWGYAYGGLYTCSYNCMRQMRQEDEERMSTENELNAVSTPSKNNYWTVEDRRTALAMQREHKPIAEIAAAIGRSERATQQWLWKHGAAPASAPEKPETVQTDSVLEAPIVKAPITRAVEQAEAAVIEAKTAYAVDRARIISVLCDAVELLRRLLTECE